MPANNRERKYTPKKGQTPATDDYGHLQPQVPDLEKVVLGALMIEKDTPQTHL